MEFYLIVLLLLQCLVDFMLYSFKSAHDYFAIKGDFDFDNTVFRSIDPESDSLQLFTF